MKKFLQIAFVSLLSIATLAACKSEKTDFNGNEPIVLGDTGYLSFGDEGLTVITDTEIVRSSVVNTDNFTCTILSDENGEQVMQFLYGERPTQPIELKVGSYKLVISSGDTPAVEWESPVYGATVPFSIVKGETNTLDVIKCKLTNIKVTVGYDVDLYNLLEAGSKSDVTIGANKMEFPYTETRAAYFYAPESENSMVVDMALNYAGKSSKMSTTIQGVKAGQWRKITINMPHVNEGNVVFTITIETLTIDEEIIVDVAEIALSEETIDDGPVVNPLAPIISWTGHDLNETFQLKASHFDQDGNCTLPVVIDVNANQSTFTSFVVHIESTSEAFMQSLTSMNFKQEFDICQVTASSDPNLNTALSMVGIPTGSKVAGKESVSVPLTNLIGLLYGYTGTHTFTLTVTNAEGHTSTQPIVMLVNPATEDGATDAPSIVWRNNDIDQIHQVDASLEVIIDVTATAGIADMVIDIDSDILTADVLADVGLASHLDLINPGELAEPLTDLGFPTGDAVKNQTSLSFDISLFMGILADFGASGDSYYADFILKVTDNNGVSTTKTLQLRIN